MHVADTFDLMSQTKFAHWNVKGSNFIGLHKLFDELAERLEGHVDELAERVTGLGGVATGTARQAAASSRVAEFPKGKKNTPARVGVFADAGVWHVGAKSIVTLLEANRIPCRVLDRSLLTSEGLEGLEAIILPGGWAPAEWAAAGDKGLAAIQKYVERGGRCLGICARSRVTRLRGSTLTISR